MPKKRADLSGLIRAFGQLPTAGKVIVALLLVAVVVYLVYTESGIFDEGGGAERTGPPGTVLFCFWNVENFYDDEDDLKCREAEEDWFAHDPTALDQKVDRLVEVITTMNGGAGPDILAMCEVESERSVEILRDALNLKLGATGFADKKYEHIAFIENNTGRRFAPAVLSKYPIVNNRVKRFGKAGDAGNRRASARTLRVPIRYNGHELIVLASHWTSRLTDEVGPRRMAYAEDTYGEYKATVLANPDADVVVCGDFNDEYEDPSMRTGLKATTAEDTVRGAIREPWMLALSGNVDRSREGTISYDNKYQVFDHILISRGLFDDHGWSYRPGDGGFGIFAKDFMRESSGKAPGPLRYGGPNYDKLRGYSDHYPVTARFYVHGADVARK